MLYTIIILSLLITVTGIFIYKQNRETPEQEATVPDADCCGAHSVCEKDSLLSMSEDITYFDDEELDSLRCKNSAVFSEEELKMIEEVFYSLQERDVAPWICSLQLRNIDLPDYIKEEAILIVSERRDKTATLYAEKYTEDK